MARMDASAIPPALRPLSDQPRVQEFLADAVLAGRVSHAYLFVGAPGSGMLEAAYALAKCVVCPQGGCAACDACYRVDHRAHPDVRLYSPASATGYLVDQVRQLMADVPLAPIRAQGKVYILDKADLLRGSAANALLKTIEEPPADVHFVLLARSVEAVLPTIASRCQQVPFRVVGENRAVRALVEQTGASERDARIALDVTGGRDAAAAFLDSDKRREVRRLVVSSIDGLAHDDDWDTLAAARAIAQALGGTKPTAKEKKARDEELRRQREERQETDEWLSRGALRQLDEASKREVAAKVRSGMMEALSAAESFLRDALLRCEGVPARIVNEDVADAVDRVASSATTEGVVGALAAVDRARSALGHNVTPQLALEAMLIEMKEALACPPSYR